MFRLERHCMVLKLERPYRNIYESGSESRSVVSDSSQPIGLYSTWDSPGQNTGVGQLFPAPGNLPNPGIKSRSPALQVDSLPAEPQGKPKNTEMGSLSLLQGIFLTQGSNWGLLHCRQILYQLSYQGISMVSPNFTESKFHRVYKFTWWQSWNSTHFWAGILYLMK